MPTHNTGVLHGAVGCYYYLNLDCARNVHLARQIWIKRLYLGLGATHKVFVLSLLGAHVHRTDRRPDGQYGQQSDGSSFGHNSSWLEEAGDPLCATPGPPGSLWKNQSNGMYLSAIN